MQVAFLLTASVFYIWRQAQTAKTDPDQLDPELHHMLIGTSTENQQQSTGRLHTQGFPDSDSAHQEVHHELLELSWVPAAKDRWAQRDARQTLHLRRWLIGFLKWGPDQS